MKARHVFDLMLDTRSTVPLNRLNNDGITPVIQACISGAHGGPSPAMVRLLAEAGARVGRMSKVGSCFSAYAYDHFAQSYVVVSRLVSMRYITCAESVKEGKQTHRPWLAV